MHRRRALKCQLKVRASQTTCSAKPLTVWCTVAWGAHLMASSRAVAADVRPKTVGPASMTASISRCSACGPTSGSSSSDSRKSSAANALMRSVMRRRPAAVRSVLSGVYSAYPGSRAARSKVVPKSHKKLIASASNVVTLSSARRRVRLTVLQSGVSCRSSASGSVSS